VTNRQKGIERIVRKLLRKIAKSRVAEVGGILFEVQLLGDSWVGETLRSEKAEAEVERLQKELAEAKFAPLGDNHHNAAACPYCNPKPDPIAAAVDAQLDPLKDELIAMGHTLAKGVPACKACDGSGQVTVVDTVTFIASPMACPQCTTGARA
jgi:hypothetical protein